MLGFIDQQFEEIAEYITRRDDRIYPIDLARLSEAVLTICSNEASPIVAVGRSSYDVLMDELNDRLVIDQPVTVLEESRDRTKRQLYAKTVPPFDIGRYFIDDVVVSGNTLQTALRAAEASERDQVVVGMAFNSKTMRKRVGLPVQSAILYEQEGGGVPAVNTFSTFARNPALAEDYVNRKNIDPGLFKTVVDLYKEEI